MHTSSLDASIGIKEYQILKMLSASPNLTRRELMTKLMLSEEEFDVADNNLQSLCYVNGTAGPDGRRFITEQGKLFLQTVPFPPSAPPVPLSDLRGCLEKLDDAEINSLCLDHFPKVYDKFSGGMRRDEKINLLLDYCRRDDNANRFLALWCCRSQLLPETTCITLPIAPPAPQNNIWQKRLHDLTKHVNDDLELLREYEDTLRYEDDPRRRARYKRDIEDLRTSAARYQQEYDELVQRLPQRREEQAMLSTQLQQLHHKVDVLLEGQETLQANLDTLRQSILSEYQESERYIVSTVVAQLEQSQVVTTQTLLAAMEAGKIQEDEMLALLTAAQKQLATIPDDKLPALTPVRQIINGPDLDTHHKLKLTLPIIPLLLEYEGDIELSGGVSLREIWQALKNRFGRK